tara:strand:+ start:200 stop:391 length:192 start_codon:yes stop_codon:yes gene_type:complete
MIRLRTLTHTRTYAALNVKENDMKLEITSKLLQKAMCAFFFLGACAHGSLFVTYLLWWLGKVD